jgi:tripartite-type tricarboxylate transporter receptor subunit TctC
MRRHFLLIAALLLAAPAQAQQFPERPLRLVIPFAPGGAADTVARTIARHLPEQLGQPVVPENRPGGNGMIGVDVVAKAPPDGHTIVLSALGALVVNPHMMRTPYDPLVDLAPVVLAVRNPLVLVANPSLPARDIAGLLAQARARPGELGVGSSGTGSTNHLAIELLNLMAGVRLLHVPYRGEGPAMADLIGGQIPLVMTTIVAARGHINGGRAIVLATAAAERTPLLPAAPTIAESGVPGYAAEAWLGVLAPGRTPPAIIARLNEAITAVLRRPEIVAALQAQGTEVATGTAAAFAAYIRSEYEKYGRLVRAVDLKPD